MKKVFFFAVLFGIVAQYVTAQALPAEKIKWYTIEEAAKLNKKHPRKVFIDVFTDWCGWCKKLDAVAFSHPVIVKYMNENYYPVKLNAEIKDSIEFNGKTYLNRNPQGMRNPHDLAIFLLGAKMGYPSLVFLNDDLSKLEVIQSYLSPNQFEAVMKYYATNAYKKQTMNEYFKSYKGEIQ